MLRWLARAGARLLRAYFPPPPFCAKVTNEGRQRQHGVWLDCDDGGRQRNVRSEFVQVVAVLCVGALIAVGACIRERRRRIVAERALYRVQYIRK